MKKIIFVFLLVILSTSIYSQVNKQILQIADTSKFFGSPKTIGDFIDIKTYPQYIFKLKHSVNSNQSVGYALRSNWLDTIGKTRPFVISGNNISLPNNYLFGIGKTPTTKLDVNGDVLINGILYLGLKTLTQQKITDYDYWVTKSKDTLDLSTIALMKDDTNKYITQYNYKNNSSYTSQAKFMKKVGSPFKAFPPFPVNFNTGVTMVDGRLAMNIIEVIDSTTFTGIKYFIKTQGSYTADNFNGFVLFKVTGTTVTQVAITANTSNAWSIPGYTTGTITFTTPYIAAPGIYYLCALSNWSAVTTAPVIDGMIISDFLTLTNANYVLVPYVAAQNTASATYNISSLNLTTSGYYYAMLPY